MKTLLIKAKKRVFTSLVGDRLAKIKGDGLDFRDLREYTFLDDAKKIDWKISAKFQKPFIKEFEEHRELNISVCYLISGSMLFGSVRLKKDVALEVMAILGFSAIKYNDRINFFTFDKKLNFFPPTKNIGKLQYILESIDKIDLIQKEYDENFIYPLNKLKKSILFIIGDFYKIPPLHLLKHETYAIIIRDKFEENPNFSEFTSVIDPVTLKEATISKKNLKAYKKFIEKKDKELIEYLLSKKIKFTKIYTDEDVFFKLGELLKWN